MAIFSSICRNTIGRLLGPTAPSSYDDNLISDCATHIPSGAGYRQFMHYLQFASSGRFQKYDYGAAENFKVYGSSTPPEYDLTNIKAKIHIIYGTHDNLVMRKNIPLLIGKIRPSLFVATKINLFNHIDFTYGRQVEKVQRLILKVTNQFYESTLTQAQSASAKPESADIKR